MATYSCVKGHKATGADKVCPACGAIVRQEPERCNFCGSYIGQFDSFCPGCSLPKKKALTTYPPNPTKKQRKYISRNGITLPIEEK